MQKRHRLRGFLALALSALMLLGCFASNLISQSKVYAIQKDEYKMDEPMITNLLPDEDIILEHGETLTVSFNASVGGQGYFRLMLPLEMLKDKIGIPMDEDEGLYTGTWIAPEGMVAVDLKIEVIYISEMGTRVSEIANGKVTIVSSEVGNMNNLPANSVIVSNEAYDVEYLNNNDAAKAKFIEWYNNGGIVYIKINSTDIVTSEGQQVSIDVLPDFLTHFDASGEVTYYEK